MEEITFISHSCLSVKVNDIGLLCDPWFFGKVFDDSWCHILEPDLDAIDTRTIKYVWISHEHPDHFNIPTLKYLSTRLCKDVIFIFRDQVNKNVIGYLETLGFNTIEIKEYERLALPGIGHITSYNKKSDTALLIETRQSSILNLNDCMLGYRKCRKIIKKINQIDYLFCQFSLAGYSGDPKDTNLLQRKKDYHLSKISEYQKLFEPSYFVPFASFVVFCTDYNSYLNQWRVSLEEVSEHIPGKNLQIVFNGDTVVDNLDLVAKRSKINIEKWNRARISQKIDITPRLAVASKQLILALEKFVELFEKWPIFSYPRSISINVLDKDLGLLLDFQTQQLEINEAHLKKPDVELSSYSLLSLIKNPWGADTLNISAEARVLNIPKWRWLLFCIHYLYKPASSYRISKYIPRIYSFFKPWL